MALIACPDCHAPVSDAAPACPKCSRPMTATTIEQTGKKWKTAQLAGGAAIIVGFLMVMGSPEGPSILAIMLLLGGIGVIGYGSFGAWWHHG